MPALNRRPITPDEALVWAQSAHVLYLDALMSQSTWTAKELVFHGGTSLKLSWNSARYSEDLDFLLSKLVRNPEQISTKVMRHVSESIRSIDPNLTVALKDKTKDPERMLAYHLVVAHPQIIGNVMVKIEFWRTDPKYLENYPTELRTPIQSFELQVFNPVPAATLETAYADKLTAFATRPHLKWRDIYDLWWIGTQSKSNLELGAVSKQFLHNLSAYNTVNELSPSEALRTFLARDPAVLMDLANTDLKKWLPPKLWEVLSKNNGVSQMVDYTRYSLKSVADHVDGVTTTTQNETGTNDAETPNLNRAPRAPVN